MVEFITMAPTSGDGDYIGAKQNSKTGFLAGESGERAPTFEYIRSIAQAAESGGFSTLLLPTGEGCLDSLAVAANLISHTSNLNFLFAVRPGSMSPSSFAKQFSTVHYWSEGRARVNIVTGGSPVELASQGDFLDHDTRYHRTREYIQILKKYFNQNERFTHEGDFYRLENAALFPPLDQQPDIYFGGASEIGKDVAASEADVYMLWGETLANTEQRINEMKEKASTYNRKLEYSISFQVILGDTEDAAFQKAHELLNNVSESQLANKKATMAKGESTGVGRLYELMEKSKNNQFVIGPNLWAGLAQVLPGNSIALVGTPEQVAERITEYVELGFNQVLLRGFPHLETIQEIGEKVIPRVREKMTINNT